MTPTEQKIIDLIDQNKFLSDDLKKRYILALFLMNSEKQEDYLELWQSFESRCQKVEDGDFQLNGDDMKNVLRSVDEVKQELIQKIQSS